jgi:hypothetical protein
MFPLSATVQFLLFGVGVEYPIPPKKPLSIILDPLKKGFKLSVGGYVKDTGLSKPSMAAFPMDLSRF